MDPECPHLIPTEDWKCEECGADIPQPELPPNYEPNLGKVAAIAVHFNETCDQFSKIIKANSDPEDPTKPKMRMIGGQIIRLPHQMVIREMIGPSYIKAKKMGYRGTQKHWQEMVWEEIIPASGNPQLSK